MDEISQGNKLEPQLITLVPNIGKCLEKGTDAEAEAWCSTNDSIRTCHLRSPPCDLIAEHVFRDSLERINDVVIIQISSPNEASRNTMRPLKITFEAFKLFTTIEKFF